MTAIEDRTDTTALPLDVEERAPVIEISNVWKLHKLGDEVVKALVAADLTVMPGEFVCLMGPSGSGKSTLLNMIGGLDRPTKGTIKVAGRDTSALTESQFAALRHDTIGFIFQSYNLIPFLSAVENVELPLMFEPYDRKSLRKRALELLELVGPRPSGRPPADQDFGRRTATHRDRTLPDQQPDARPRRRADGQPRPPHGGDGGAHAARPVFDARRHGRRQHP